MRLKITSNGIDSGTKVVDADTGQLIEGITAVGWYVDVKTGAAVATFQTIGAEIDVVAEHESNHDAFDAIKRMMGG